MSIVNQIGSLSPIWLPLIFRVRVGWQIGTLSRARVDTSGANRSERDRGVPSRSKTNCQQAKGWMLSSEEKCDARTIESKCRLRPTQSFSADTENFCRPMALVNRAKAQVTRVRENKNVIKRKNMQERGFGILALRLREFYPILH